MFGSNMKEKRVIIKTLLILTGLLLILCIFSINNVSATTVKELDNINVDSNKTVEINNTNAPKHVIAPKNYSISKKYAKTKGIETKRNTIKTKIGKKYTFITKYFIPGTWKNGGKNGKTEYWHNCQSMAIKGKYIYIYTSAGYGSSKGFIIRYDTKILDKYNKGKGLSKLRKLGICMKTGKKLTKEQKRIKKGIKIGKKFNGGHGQSLSYDPKTKSLWMWQDNNYNSSNQKLMKISMKTLKPYLTYKFKAKLGKKYLKAFHNLAFDEKGNFYTDKTIKTKKNPLGYSYIFSGRFHNGKIQMKLLTKIKNRPGTYSQALAINHKNNRIYLVSDGVIYSAPLTKLVKGTINMHDFRYSVFSTKREFEGLSFDNNGKAYLLLIRGSEILKSTAI